MTNSHPQKSIADEAAIERVLQASLIGTVSAISFLVLFCASSLVCFDHKFGPSTTLLLLLCTIKPLLTWYNSGGTMKKKLYSQPVSPTDPNHARVVRLVNELVPIVGLKSSPEIVVTTEARALLGATGRSPEKAVIRVGNGLLNLQQLTSEELKALLAHELAHVKQREVALQALTSSLALVSTIAVVFTLSSSLLALLALPLVSSVMNLTILFIIRSRETMSDALSARWTGNPLALASALQKVEGHMKRFDEAEKRHEERRPELRTGSGKPSFVERQINCLRAAGRAHPLTEVRVRALESMTVAKDL